MTMLVRLLKIMFGLTLLPFCAGYTWQFFSMAFTGPYQRNAPYLFLGGALSYLVIHVLFKKPVFTYVIGHELTHALFALLSGGSVKSIHASSKGGRVIVTKSNFVITLAPYFFPLYTFLVLLLYGAAISADAGGAAINILIFLCGATFSLHLTLTFVFLRTDQSDIKEQGAVFSYPLIYLFNIAFAALLLKIHIAVNMDYRAFLAGGIIRTIDLIRPALELALAFLRSA